MNFLFVEGILKTYIPQLISKRLAHFVHEDLGKAILCSVTMQLRQKELNGTHEKLIRGYYAWVNENYFDPCFSRKQITDFFILKHICERYFKFFEQHNSKCVYGLNFDEWKYLAQVWGVSLQHTLPSYLDFFKAFAIGYYEIPFSCVEKIIELLQISWRPIFPPLGLLPQKKYQLEELKRYFFGLDFNSSVEIYEVEEIDRFFSILFSNKKSHVYISKTSDFDVFEASQVIHEFQHTQELPGSSLFLSEKNALHAEKTFLQIMATGRRGRFAWFESHLFYPLILLKAEIYSRLKSTDFIIEFENMCEESNIRKIELSSLYSLDVPFQFALYPACAMSLDSQWQTFLTADKMIGIT